MPPPRNSPTIHRPRRSPPQPEDDISATMLAKLEERCNAFRKEILESLMGPVYGGRQHLGEYHSAGTPLGTRACEAPASKAPPVTTKTAQARLPVALSAS